MWKGRSNTFFYDEWSWIESRRGGLRSGLDSYNQHLELVPLAAYQLLLGTVGLAHYWTYRLLAVLGHLACATAVFVFARRRIGAAAWLPAVVVVFLGSGWEFILWGVNFGFTTSMALGVAALLALDRGDRRGEVMACGLLIVGLMFSEFAVLFSLGIAVESSWRHRGLSRSWIWGVPLALYIGWWLAYYEPYMTHIDLAAAPKFIANMASSAAGGLFGIHLTAGRAVLLVLVVFVGWRIVRRHALTPRLVGLSVTLGSFWLLVALGRAQLGQPWLSRYVYTGAILIVLIIAESCRGTRLNTRTIPVAVLLTVLALVGNIRAFNGGEHYLSTGSRTVAAELGALELARATAPQTLVLDPHYGPQIVAGPYFAAVRAIGSSPADTPAQLQRRPETERAAVDSVLLRAGELQITSPSGSSPPALGNTAPVIERTLIGSASTRGPCVELHPSAGAAAVELVLPPGGLQLHAASVRELQLHARRFATSFSPGRLIAPTGANIIIIRQTRDRSMLPWRLQISSRHPIRACTLRWPTVL